MKTSFKALFLLLLISMSQLIAAVPQKIDYQGYLTRPSGVPLDTTVAMTFTIYDAIAGGSNLWSETQFSVVVQKGLFNVNLGVITPLPWLVVFTDTSRWLEIQVGSDAPMTPRRQFLSDPFAFYTGTIDGAMGGTITSDVNIQNRINVGSANTNTGTFAMVHGQNNHARGDYSVVSGGGSATPVDSNSATGQNSMIPGGSRNEAVGAYSFAAGHRAKAFHEGAFVWADHSAIDFNSTAVNEFNVRASGGTRIFSNSGLTAGVTLAAGAGAWVAVSDSTKKQNRRLVNTKDILQKVSELPIEQWSYKSQSPSIEHIGPMAQNFYSLFKLGEDSLGISTIDPDGISLAAIQELAKRNSKLETQNSKLEERIQKLENIIEQMASEKNGIKKASYSGN